MPYHTLRASSLAVACVRALRAALLIAGAALLLACGDGEDAFATEDLAAQELAAQELVFELPTRGPDWQTPPSAEELAAEAALAQLH